MRSAAAILAVVFGCLGLVALRDATLSTHEPVAPGSRIELVVRVDTHGEEQDQSAAEITEALLLACRLEVNSDLVGEVEALGGDEFGATFAPSMDRTDRRQFRGCLEDWSADHVRADVIRLGGD